jgi:hypothetical protein
VEGRAPPEILTPEQRPAFDALAEAHERRRRAEIDLPPAP